MKNIALLAAGAALLTLAACATAKTYSATGGSRSDGVVRLAYEVGMFEVPEVDEAQGERLAKERCAVWGYTGADPFGGVTRQCTQMGSSGCMVTLITKEYQCTGQGNGGRAEIKMTEYGGV